MNNHYHHTIHTLSERIVNAQRPIRVLDALKWSEEVRESFFASQCKKLPAVLNSKYYLNNPLCFDPEKKIEEFTEIERDIRSQLGQFNPVGAMLRRICSEYCTVIEMLQARGTPRFHRYSQQLYGGSRDVFYAGAPTLTDLANLITKTLKGVHYQLAEESDQAFYTSEEAIMLLGKRLKKYFTDDPMTIRVQADDDIVADAAAGAEYIKLRKNAMFSVRVHQF